MGENAAPAFCAARVSSARPPQPVNAEPFGTVVCHWLHLVGVRKQRCGNIRQVVLQIGRAVDRFHQRADVGHDGGVTRVIESRHFRH